jgi:hypothetical protein
MIWGYLIFRRTGQAFSAVTQSRMLTILEGVDRQFATHGARSARCSPMTGARGNSTGWRTKRVGEPTQWSKNHQARRANCWLTTYFGICFGCLICWLGWLMLINLGKSKRNLFGPVFYLAKASNIHRTIASPTGRCRTVWEQDGTSMIFTSYLSRVLTFFSILPQGLHIKYSLSTWMCIPLSK